MMQNLWIQSNLAKHQRVYIIANPVLNALRLAVAEAAALMNGLIAL